MKLSRRKEVLNVGKIIEEAIGIGFDEKDFDEIMEYTEKGDFETVQDAVMNAIRTCANK